MPPGQRCPSCGHTWEVHHIRQRGLTRESWCDVAGCSCTREVPEKQATVEGATA